MSCVAYFVCVHDLFQNIPTYNFLKCKLKMDAHVTTKRKLKICIYKRRSSE